MITIFTPTYNRRNELTILFESLQNQSIHDFEWIIVDDGSVDDTMSLCEGFLNTAKFPIRFFFQENQGKHMAYNKGIEEARGDLFCCVDSDDWLVREAVEFYCSLNKINGNHIGFVLPQKLEGHDDSYKWKRIENAYVNICDLKAKYSIAESNIVIKTSILRKYKFKRFLGRDGNYEKFCPEGYLYNQLVEEGSFLVVNKGLYCSKYLKGGLTRSINELWLNNSEGVLQSLRIKYSAFGNYNFYDKMINRTKCIVLTNALCMACKRRIAEYTPSKMMSFILYIPSLLYKFGRFVDE